VHLDREELLAWLGLTADEVPAALVLEGSWWQRERNERRLALLERSRELGFPELHLGWYRGVPVLYSCVYGAPRAVEPVHVFSSLGSRLVVMIGSCGALQPHVRTGDIIVPTRARIGEGASQYYGGADWSAPDERWVAEAATRFEALGLTVHCGPLLTTSALFAQPEDRVAQWRKAGYLGVDMETSAVFTAARALGMEAVSAVFAWDELYRGRSFLSPFDEDERRAHEHANDAIYAVALELAVLVRDPPPARA
jgi:uridine phosphorylase